MLLGLLAVMGVITASAVFDAMTGFETGFEAGWFGAWAYILICYELVDKPVSRGETE